MTDSNPLLNPPKEPSARMMKLIDGSTWVLPIGAAILSSGAAVAALLHADLWAAIFGIVAGILGAAGVITTNVASRIRDNRLSVTHAVASLGVDMADQAQRANPHHW